MSAIGAVAMAALVAAAAAAGAEPAPAADPAAAPPPAAEAAPVPAARVSAFRADPSIEVGERVTVRGRVAPGGVHTVRLQRLGDDGTWTPWATVRTTRTGRFAAAIPLASSASVRAIVADQGEESAGRRIAVSVHRAVDLRWAVDPTEAIAGRPIGVVVTARPARPGETIAIEGRVGRKGWIVLARRKAAVGGVVRTTVTVPNGGRWRLRARVAADAHNAEGVGADPRAVDAYGRNPHGTPTDAPHYIVQMINEMKLYYYEGGSLRRVLPVVFGAPGTPTPSGRYAVYSKGAGPGPAFGPLVLWYHRGYGIHGTNQEYLLERSWRYYSHGCTRNYNDNIRWLWPRVPVGTPVVNIR